MIHEYARIIVYLYRTVKRELNYELVDLDFSLDSLPLRLTLGRQMAHFLCPCFPYL